MGSPTGPIVYDKGKYHLEAVEEYGLPEAHAYHHTVYFLRWLLENALMSEAEPFDRSSLTNDAVLKIYEWWDCCLMEDLLSDEGNAFAQHYFDFDKGRYISDYMELLKGDLLSEFHIPLTEENYQKLKRMVDRRFAQWKDWTQRRAGKGSQPTSSDVPPASPKRWWQFWRR